MDNTKPTSAPAVAKWLRTLATPDQIEIGGGYPFLFGMATVKLAEAHAEIATLTAKLVAAQPALDILGDVSDLLDDYSDVSDGDYGEPRPNRAMSMRSTVEAILERSGR